MPDKHDIETKENRMLKTLKELNVSLREFHDMGFTYRRTHIDAKSPDEFKPLVLRIVERIPTQSDNPPAVPPEYIEKE